MNSATLIASHYGTVKFDDLTCEAVVLPDGRRGYVQRQLARLLGFSDRQRGDRFVRFLGEMSPKSLSSLKEKGVTVMLPSGQRAQFLPAGIIADVAAAVVNGALCGSLHKARVGIVPNCMKIMRALAITGEVALIDEATGYQHHRESDALQELIGKLLRQSCATWERRFKPDYYRALYRLFRWEYRGHTQNPPHVVGNITHRWVYSVVLPVEMMDEIRARKSLSQRHHQWLADPGLARLQSQIHAVTAIARSSTCYRDFTHRCEAAFAGAPLQLGLLADEVGEAA